MMNNRPTDWQPLADSDPFPGSWEAWEPIISYWQDQAREITTLANELKKQETLEGESATLRRMETLAQSGVGVLMLMAEEFETAAATISTWKTEFERIQNGSKTCLDYAQTAQDEIQRLTAEIDRVQKEIDADPDDLDPMLKTQLDGFLFFPGLKDNLAYQQEVLEAQRAQLTKLQEDFDAAEKAFRSTYSLSNLDPTLLDQSGGNSFAPFVSSEKVRDFLFNYDADGYKKLAENAVTSPEAYQEYLDTLAGLSETELAIFFTTHPALANYPLYRDSPDSVVDAALAFEWWSSLDEARKQQLINLAPGLIGNMEGVDYTSRNLANRNLLDRLLDDQSLAQGTRDSLENLKANSSGEDHYIIFLDLTPSLIPHDKWDENNVRAAVSVGNPDTAENTTFISPGMGNDLAEGVATHVQVAGNVRREQAIAAGEDPDKFAVIAWLGYDTPNMSRTADRNGMPIGSGSEGVPEEDRPSQSVLSRDLAEKAAPAYIRAIDGFNVTRSMADQEGLTADRLSSASAEERRALLGDPNLDIVGHSYGTTQVGFALPYLQTSVNSVIFVGSAGLLPETVERANRGDFPLESSPDGPAEGQLYFVIADDDLLARVGLHSSFRSYPSDINFAQGFSAEGGSDWNGQIYHRTEVHSALMRNGKLGYFAEGTGALRLLALATTNDSGSNLPHLIVDPQASFGRDNYLAGYPVVYYDPEDLANNPQLRQELMKQLGITPEQVLGYEPPQKVTQPVPREYH